MPGIPIAAQLLAGAFIGCGVLYGIYMIFKGYVSNKITAGNLEAYERSEQAANAASSQMLADANQVKSDNIEKAKSDFDL